MLVEKVSVKNFKLFGDFSVEGLRQFTLLGGDNNCGKTALLEAILLCAHRKRSAYPVQTALRENRTKDEAFADMFRHRDIGSAFAIACQGNGTELAAEGKILTETRDEYDEPRIGDLPPKGFDPDKPMSIGTVQVKRLQIDYRENGDCGGMLFKLGPDYPYLTAAPVGRFRESPRFVHMRVDGGLARRSGVFAKDPDNLSALDNFGKKPEILDALKIISPAVRDAVVGSEHGKSGIWVEIEGTANKIPAAFLGAGVQKFLSLMLVLLLGNGGLFLLDEITTGWHHARLAELWKMIFRVCEERGHQIIATTHSREGIAAFAQAAKDEGAQDDACYIRLDSVEWESDPRRRIKPSSYSGELLWFATHEMETEVR